MREVLEKASADPLTLGSISFKEPVIITSASEYLHSFGVANTYHMKESEIIPTKREYKFENSIGNVATWLFYISEDYLIAHSMIEKNEIELNIYNRSNEDRTLDFIIAEYHEDNLIDVTFNKIEVNTDVHKIERFSIPETTNKIKLMLWESDTLNPIIDAISL